MADRYFERGDLVTRYTLEGDGPVLTLIHGVGSDMESWDAVVKELGSGFRVLRYDLRGFGQSSKVMGRYELSHFINDHTALLDHLEIAACHVVGFSLGGLIAQGIAIQHPDRVDKLVLSSTIAGRTKEEAGRSRQQLHNLERGIAGDHFRKSLDRYFTPEFQKAHPEIIDRLEERNKRNDPECYAAAYRVIVETDLADELHRIKAETLVMTGEHDRGCNPRMAALMQDRIPNAKRVIHPKLRHNVLAEAPDQIARELRDFLVQ